LENIYFGVPVFLISAIGYYYSWRAQSINKTSLALLLLILCGLILRFYVGWDLFLHSWDERYHALVAKNLINHPFLPTLYETPLLPFDYKGWADNHVWLHKQPLPLWTIALSLKIFGIHEIALRIPSIILSTIGILVTYEIARILYSQKVAFIAAFLFSIHGLIIELAGGRVPTDHYDIFFLFTISIAILFSLKFAITKKFIYNFIAGLAIGLAILTKWLPALIVLPVWILVILNYKKFSTREIIVHGLILILIVILVFLPWQIYIHLKFPLEAAWEDQFNVKHITEVLEGNGGSLFYHFIALQINYGELVYIPVLWFCWKCIKKLRSPSTYAILIWFIIPYLFFTIAKTKMQAYTLFSAPAIFIIIALFFRYITVYTPRFKYKLVPALLMIGLLLLPVRYSIERIKPFTKIDREPQWTKEIKEMKSLHGESKGRLAIFNSAYPVETMFYLDCTAYPNIPDKAKISELKDLGYKIIILPAQEFRP